MQAAKKSDYNNLKWQLMLGCLVVFLNFNSVRAGELSGEVAWQKRVELGTPVRGIVSQVHVQAGAMVKKNQVLLELDRRGFQARVNALKAQLSSRKSVFEEAARERDRALELYDRTVLSEHDLQVAKNQYTTAEADYRITAAELAQAELDLEHSRIMAPFDGVVVARHAEVGQSVVPDLNPIVLFVVADPYHLNVVAFLKREQLAEVKAGMTVGVRVRQTDYTGNLVQVALEPDAGAAKLKQYRVTVEFDTQGMLIPIGTPATIKLP